MDRHAAAVSAAAAAADEAARRERERQEKLNAPPVTAVRKETTIPVYLVGLLLARRPVPKVRLALPCLALPCLALPCLALPCVPP